MGFRMTDCFRIDGHYTGNGIIEKFERQIPVSIINQDIVRIFRYPVVDVRVFGNFRIPAGQSDRFLKRYSGLRKQNDLPLRPWLSSSGLILLSIANTAQGVPGSCIGGANTRLRTFC